MAKVYLVSAGNYSDYCIQAVFSSKELAEQWISKHSKDAHYFDIEEWGLDEECDYDMRDLFWVEIDLATGNLKRELVTRRWAPVTAREDAINRYRWPNPVIMASSFVSKDHALKLAAEKRQEILREGE